MDTETAAMKKAVYVLFSFLLVFSVGAPTFTSSPNDVIDVPSEYTLITLDPAEIKTRVAAGETVVIDVLGMPVELRLFVREFISRSLLAKLGLEPFTYEGYANGTGYARFVLRETHLRGTIRLSGTRFIVESLEEHTKNPTDRYTFVTYGMPDPFTERGVPDGWQPLIARAQARPWRELEISIASDQNYRSDHQDWEYDALEVMYYAEEAYYFGILKYDFIITDKLEFTRQESTKSKILKEYSDWMNGTRGAGHDVGHLFAADDSISGGSGWVKGFQYSSSCSLTEVAWCAYSQYYDTDAFWLHVDGVSHEIGHNLNASADHLLAQTWGTSITWYSVMWHVRLQYASGWITDGSKYAKNKNNDWDYWNYTKPISDYTDPQL